MGSLGDDLPPAIPQAEGKALREGDSRASVFSRIGKSDHYEAEPAVFNVGADRCYTYRAEGTDGEGGVYDSWWICFAGGKLVHKEPPDGDKERPRLTA